MHATNFPNDPSILRSRKTKISNVRMFSWMIASTTVSIHCAPEMSEIDCIGRIESFWPKFVRGW